MKASLDSYQFLSFFSHVFPYFLEISLKLFFLKSKYFMLLKNNPNETGKLKIGAIWKHCIFSNLNVKVLVKDKVICIVGSSRDLLPKQPTMQLVCMVFTFLDFFFKMIHNEVCKRHKVHQIYFANARARVTNKCTLQISTYLGMMSHKVSSSCVLPLLNAAVSETFFQLV